MWYLCWPCWHDADHARCEGHGCDCHICAEFARDASAVVPEVGPPASGTATRAARAETGPHGDPLTAAGSHPFRLIHPAGGSGCAAHGELP